MPWVDVPDEEPKSNLKRNGTTMNGDNGHRRKKARHSYNSGSGSGGSAGPSASTTIQEQRAQLPIAQGREALIEEIRSNDVTVLLGETGSGKTTQIPQYIFESGLAGNGVIAITQPRRVAATSLAARVALEQNAQLGQLVGYSVRFDEKYSSSTRIKYMTDGMIVRELLSDPMLSRYSVVIVDEAHERTLRTDLLIANLKKILKARNGPIADDAKGKKQSHPLKVVIMSATLDAEKFSRFFYNAKILYVQGRQHPVTNYYAAENQLDYVDSAMRTFFQIHLDRPPGDVLIFLPGQEDIESLQASIDLFAKQLPSKVPGVLICSMFAAQDQRKNSQVFAPTPPNTRKCILATNIAETSITIPGVTYVIDTGKCKEKQFLARSAGGGFDTLLTRDITKSSAMQRSGRAGREGKGYCFRLYTEASFNAMTPSAEPEILRCSLTSSILQLKCLNQNLEDLDLMDSPDPDSIISSLKTLWLLGAIDNKAKLTPAGREMAAFPLEPQYACAVVASKNYGCTSEILDIVSVISASSKLFIDASEHRDTATEVRRKFRHPTGDHMTILNIVRAYREVTASTVNGTVVYGPGGSNEGSAKGNNKDKAAKREWCRKHFLNERALLEAKDIRDQLRMVCERVNIDWTVSALSKKSGENEGRTEEDAIVRSMGHGLVGNAAFLQPDGTYKQNLGPSTVKIHPSSSMCDKKVPAIIYDELVYTNQIYARGVSAISKAFFASHSAFTQRKA
ncbi:ATP-dependent RNA helicase Prh1 [Coprinopsis cinerea okayama7|uniref:RNA helicase n=1 Tax=Coprinopsis cinerea (strain Okayama-7 / 130 / ATCC MYA-4618 / FGSC 9003) TaxID=240176 RepID=A8NQZ0_COPC7|nr:ATP-dependent RNA helicase Prh1 [Coprinopsis cinerea okayama7\|eukprot:XP_001835580.2 ATP-dependent RNA helicase Prh1 [Coprinopsis cinerea okayama7\